VVAVISPVKAATMAVRVAWSMSEGFGFRNEDEAHIPGVPRDPKIGTVIIPEQKI
jgi:hypothetical protein